MFHARLTNAAATRCTGPVRTVGNGGTGVVDVTKKSGDVGDEAEDFAALRRCGGRIGEPVAVVDISRKVTGLGRTQFVELVHKLLTLDVKLCRDCLNVHAASPFGAPP